MFWARIVLANPKDYSRLDSWVRVFSCLYLQIRLIDEFNRNLD